MKKITAEACQAFENAYNYKKGNTKVEAFDDLQVELRLHGNLIAYSDQTGIYISNAAYKTNVTKERLNGLTGVHIQQKDFVWYLNGEAWNGDWIRIGD
tara:strand:- start:210 stop:503 length:294 start_codon:yes stop_codon:yes gene_type:complete